MCSFKIEIKIKLILNHSASLKMTSNSPVWEKLDLSGTINNHKAMSCFSGAKQAPYITKMTSTPLMWVYLHNDTSNGSNTIMLSHIQVWHISFFFSLSLVKMYSTRWIIPTITSVSLSWMSAIKCWTHKAVCKSHYQPPNLRHGDFQAFHFCRSWTEEEKKIHNNHIFSNF